MAAVLGFRFAWLRARGNGAVESANPLTAINATPAPTPEPKPKVAIQAGHWKISEVPEEFGTLKWGGGAQVGNVTEWETVLDIANRAAAILRADGVDAEVLPATVPEDYQADAFVSLHADGNDVTSVSGYKTASSYWDATGLAPVLSADLLADYAKVAGTVMSQDPNVTDDMTQYYAFNYNRFVHTLSSGTPAAIMELGFLTNAGDRSFLTGKPQTVAAAVADGIEDFLKDKKEGVKASPSASASPTLP